MKKRLLITSVVMMLVVAVALATSTYAWFTSNATVTANEVTMKATTSTAPALGISWIDGNYGTEITPKITAYSDDPEDPNHAFTFSPVAPLTLSTSGTITDSTVQFKTATTYSDAGVYKFNANGGDATHATYTVTDGAGHTSFFLKNLSTNNNLTGTLTMSASITGTGAGLMRVGVFKYNSTSEKYELIEVLANEDPDTYTAVVADTPMDTDTTYYMFVNGQYVVAEKGTVAADLEAGKNWYPAMAAPSGKFYTRTDTDAAAKAVYGSIVEGAEVNAMTTYTCATSKALGTNLAALTKIELKVIIWMDAAALGDDQQGQVGNVTLNFRVA